MDKQPAFEALVVLIKQTAPKNVVLVWHKVYHSQMVVDALIFAKIRIKENLYQKETTIKKIKT